MLGWMYTLFFVLLGLSAAIGAAGWNEVGPRKAGLLRRCCWCGGLVSASSACATYISLGWWARLGGDRRDRSRPRLYLAGFDADEVVSDRRGMATGMAIMGFGGGALIGAPLADLLMDFFKYILFGRCLADLSTMGVSISSS